MGEQLLPWGEGTLARGHPEYKHAPRERPTCTTSDQKYPPQSRAHSMARALPMSACSLIQLT